MAATRVAYVFPNSRRDLIAQCAAGTAPDTHLLGLNQLAQLGIEAEAREPALDRRAQFLPTRVRWHLRELPLPWELRDVDVAFTALTNLDPARVAVAIHGVDHDFFKPVAEARERLVLAVGRDLARDYATLVEA